LAKKTATALTCISHSESAVSQLWVLETLTTKLSAEHLQVLHPHLQHLQHQLKLEQERTQEEC
jgi:hypothetical protein